MEPLSLDIFNVVASANTKKFYLFKFIFVIFVNFFPMLLNLRLVGLTVDRMLRKVGLFKSLFILIVLLLF